MTQTDWDTGDLAVLDLLTGQKRQVTDNGDEGYAPSYGFNESACFSPDGQRIAYVWVERNVRAARHQCRRNRFAPGGKGGLQRGRPTPFVRR